jgi:Domain of unknown function (DUF222)/RibD C-terminal domain
MRRRRSRRSQPESEHNLVVLGSGNLVRALATANLVDEYMLSIHPLALGAGRRLFDAASALRLVDTRTTTTGVIIATLIYEPTANCDICPILCQDANHRSTSLKIVVRACESVGMDDALALLDSGSVALLDRPLFGLADATLTAAVGTIQTVIGRLTATQAALVREIDGRGLVRQSGAANASTWLRDRTRVSITDAHKLTRLGQLLDTRPELAAAINAGNITTEQALVIGRAIDNLPNDCEPAVIDKALAILIEHGIQFEPALLSKLGDRVLAHVAPDVADQQLRRRLEREERQAARDRVLTLSPDGYGRTLLRGVLDTESTAILRAAIEPLMTPIPTGPAGPDLRTVGGRRADALIEVCRLALRTGELPIDGGQPPQVNVTIDFDTLTGNLGVNAPTGVHGSNAPTGKHGGGTPAGGTLDTGETLSAATVRRIACDARILPIVLNGASIPIDIGRARRLYTGATRTAILIRDHGCAFPACDRPPRWCDIHHITPWHRHGPTNRDNGVALCHHHHKLIHHHNWTITLDHNQRPQFTPPSHIDPTQTPQQNQYHSRT